MQVISVFQFHKGSIRTFGDFEEWKKDVASFNSIKVQLEHVSQFDAAVGIHGFNSIKVQLERV